MRRRRQDGSSLQQQPQKNQDAASDFLETFASKLPDEYFASQPFSRLGDFLNRRPRRPYRARLATRRLQEQPSYRSLGAAPRRQRRRTARPEHVAQRMKSLRPECRLQCKLAQRKGASNHPQL